MAVEPQDFEDLSIRYKAALGTYQRVVERNSAVAQSGGTLSVEFLREERQAVDLLQQARRAMFAAMK